MSSFYLTPRKRGDTIRLLIRVTRPDDDGVSQPVNLTGAALTFTAKTLIDNEDDDPSTIQKTIGAGITVLDLASGLALARIESEDTIGLTSNTTYVCDVQLVESNGDVSTVADGVIPVVKDVTKAA